MGGQQDESTYAPYNDNDLPPLHLAVVFPPILKYVIEYKESEASPPPWECVFTAPFVYPFTLFGLYALFFWQGGNNDKMGGKLPLSKLFSPLEKLGIKIGPLQKSI